MTATETPPLNEQSAVTLRQAIGRGAVSSVSLVEACFEAIDRLNPAVNAVVAMDRDAALTAASDADRAVAAGAPLGLLHGLPVGIKDLTATKGLRTTWGSELFRDRVPEQDDGVAARVRAAGGIILAKTNTPEFGAGANTINSIYGATVNPFDTKRTCGGSSGGSGVVLATDMMPLATGSDMGGSLRIPAAFCGVVGFRPSPGLVPHCEGASGWSPLGVQGPMARTVDDTALLLAAIAAFDPLDPLSFPVEPETFARPPATDLKRLKVAVSPDLGFAPVDGHVREQFENAVAALTPYFGQVTRADPDLGEADDIFEITRATQFVVSHLAKYNADPDALGPNVIANLQQGFALSIQEATRGVGGMTGLYRSFVRFMQDYDILLSPTVGVPPFDVETLYLTDVGGMEMRNYFHWLAATYGITLTTHPAISLPAGLDATGAPFGLQITGRRHNDLQLLGIAKEVERALSDRPKLSRPVPDHAYLTGDGRTHSKAGVKIQK